MHARLFRQTAALARPIASLLGARATCAALMALGLAANSFASTSEAEPASAHLQQLVAMGTRFEHAEGTEKNFVRAHELYCEAARLDSTDALVRLGWMYANGRGVPRNDSIAHSLFHRAGVLGHQLGARLAIAVTGDPDQFPACLVAEPLKAQAPPTAEIPPIRLPDAPAQAPATSAKAPVASTSPNPPVVAPATIKPGVITPERKQWILSALKMAAEFKLDPRLVFALIRAESAFDPLAKSPKNAQGLMQLIPETAERFAVKDVWDPQDNLRGGMSYLRWLLSYFKGDVMLALAGYNAGEGAVDRHKGVPPYPETLAYVQRIRAIYPFDHHPFDPKVALPLRATWLSGVSPSGVAPSVAKTAMTKPAHPIGRP